MGVELHHNEQVADVIREMFASRGRRMAENNLRQAQVPVGATIIAQTRGTAPGLICPVRIGGVEKVIYVVQPTNTSSCIFFSGMGCDFDKRTYAGQETYVYTHNLLEAAE